MDKTPMSYDEALKQVMENPRLGMRRVDEKHEGKNGCTLYLQNNGGILWRSCTKNPRPAKVQAGKKVPWYVMEIDVEKGEDDSLLDLFDDAPETPKVEVLTVAEQKAKAKKKPKAEAPKKAKVEVLTVAEQKAKAKKKPKAEAPKKAKVKVLTVAEQKAKAKKKSKAEAPKEASDLGLVEIESWSGEVSKT